ncbi:hypothetical protein [Alloactinosynnema sp. L-07]|uniref:hypothetical protein n=1 Tax=Alloactinosynnema sp. L-07 TaxID=1653480 RepID=UPI00065EF18A|nr:hypothetical protein [Alloactinosynnema sp. L-07]CRK59358.1 hypothetical protein [Alloactinosynnema sp. L-07]
MTIGFWDSFGGIHDAAQQLKAASNEGFTVSGPGVQVMIDAVVEMLRDVSDALDSADRFAQEPALGQTPAALVYKPFMATIATDPVQGFIPFMKGLQKDLADIEASLRKSMTSYQDSDQTGASGITAAGS